MKIVFICGSLEPGRDGVGDYTRRLGCELIRQSHEVRIVALNDKHIQSLWRGSQSDENTDIQVVRLSAMEHWKKRMQTAKDFSESFQPEWISLQFVPFIFHPKGLLFGLGAELKRTFGGRKTHVMVHELWVGMAIEESFKLKLWGKLQKDLIKKFLKKLAPDIIHTQTHLYEAQLKKIGFNAFYLPLFSNIPLIAKEVNSHSKGIILVLFGSIHKSAPVEALAKDVAEYSKKQGKGVHLSLIGRNGNEQERWVSAWESAGLTVDVLGERSSEEIAEIINGADGGIVTTAYAVVEKSGSLAALRSYGLPVLCVSPSWSPYKIKDLPNPTGVFNYTPGMLEKFFQLHKSGKSDNIDTVSRLLINSLSEREHPLDS